MGKLVLGLDLGPNSIGWALVCDDPDNRANSKLIDLGVRVFPEGVDNFDSPKEKSRNEGRRTARGMRRQIARRARRRRALRDALIESRLWPGGSAAQAELIKGDPYELRAKALDEQLTLHEIGRILLHLSRRRGFKSNKKEEAKADAVRARRSKSEGKKDKPDSEKKTGDLLIEMAELQSAIQQSGARTLGKYLHLKAVGFRNPYKKHDPLYHDRKAAVRRKHSNREVDDHVRGRHTLRQMLIDEFIAIWKKQSEFHGDVLTEKLCFGAIGRQKDIQKPIPKWSERRKGANDLESFGLFGLIFFHRTLKPVPKEIVGTCELESNERRCARADRRAQRFRLLQEINNLEYIDPDARKDCRLSDGQRAMLVEHLSTREKATFDDIRDKLGFLSTVKFNLERGKRASIKGMVTDWQMAKSVGKQWHKLSDDVKDGVVDALIRSVDDDATHARLVESFGLSADEANRALGVDLPAGYLQLSLVAINKLLPFMNEGFVYEHRDPTRSARAAAGYDEPWALQKRLFAKLPDPRRTKPADCPIADIPNPVVKRALVELRKVVNAILRVYGRPDEIHVEMGRDVKTRPKDKTSPAYWKYKQEEDERAERESKRTAAKDKLRENGISFGANGRNILKYLLWEEQGKVCIYSGKCISFNKLFSSEVQIDHILPHSQSIDNSPMNMVVCYCSENAGFTGKGQQTPRAWLEHSDLDKYKAVCQRAKSLPYPKYKRFLRIDAKREEFIERQLNDNRYIAKATVEYLKCLFELESNKRGAVLGLKGQLTATLRRQWALDTILEGLPDSPAWQERKAGKLRPGQKNRADHRHHAIDAVVLAMTNRSQLERLADGFTVGEFADEETGDVKHRTVYRGDAINPPWPSFRQEVLEKVGEINGRRFGVSHHVERKVRGALHADSFYWKTELEGQFVKRKPLADLSPSEIDKIRDGGIKQLVTDRLKEAGIDFGRGTTLEKSQQKLMKTVLAKVAMNSGVPVKKVRLLIPEKTIRPIRSNGDNLAYVKPDSTHHLCLYRWQENGKTKCDAAFITMIDAADRINQQKKALGRLLNEWKDAGLSVAELNDRKRSAMRSIAKQFPAILRDANKLSGNDRERIPPQAEFVMSLSSRELLLLEIDGEDHLYVYITAASTTRQMSFYPHISAKYEGKTYGELTKYPNSLLPLNPRKVTVDPLGRIRWAND